MYILEILFAIGILISLILPGACYELYFRKLPTNINNLLVGFLILITFGTITKILTFSLISNQKVWLFSYLLILAISIIYLLRKKSLNIVIRSFISINYLNFIFLRSGCITLNLIPLNIFKKFHQKQQELQIV